ncbi:hypothetical protein JHK82_044493 [Glycine max]|nr:hypothetical protein JHK82_044493 [Glycine max]
MDKADDSGLASYVVGQIDRTLRWKDNSIAYWRKFVAEYYSPRAKKRWSLSLYSNDGHHALGVVPQAAMATYEVLPRLNEIKFGSGVIDELLFLDLPRETRLEESVYEPLRVVREGQLHIIFTQDLKILSWEFCARCHEELLPRRLVAPQTDDADYVEPSFAVGKSPKNVNVASNDLWLWSNVSSSPCRQSGENSLYIMVDHTYDVFIGASGMARD